MRLNPKTNTSVFFVWIALAVLIGYWMEKYWNYNGFFVPWFAGLVISLVGHIWLYERQEKAAQKRLNEPIDFEQDKSILPFVGTYSNNDGDTVVVSYYWFGSLTLAWREKFRHQYTQEEWLEKCQKNLTSFKYNVNMNPDNSFKIDSIIEVGGYLNEKQRLSAKGTGIFTENNLSFRIIVSGNIINEFQGLKV